MSIPVDTLAYDTVRIAKWQADPSYDYNRELVTPEVDIFSLFNMWFARLMRKIFGSRFAEQYSEIILIALLIIVLLLVVWFLYKKRPELFMRVRKRVSYSVQEDTIYGVDFAEEIQSALSRNDYREAVRLLYLQTLKQLSDEERIDWQPYKTPTEYIYEVRSEAQRKPFRELTTRFLRVRYGNFEASDALFHEMQSLQKDVEKGGVL